MSSCNCTGQCRKTGSCSSGVIYTHPAKTEDEPNWKEMYWEMHELNHKHWSELKAHPAKTLTGAVGSLSDEEIEQLQAEYDIDSGLTCHSVKDFARAIEKRIKNGN